MKNIKIIALLTCLCLSVQTFAAFTFRDGEFVNLNNVATLSEQGHFKLGCTAVRYRDLEKAIKEFNLVRINFPECEEGQAALYYLGICYFYSSEFDIANEYFSEYLQSPFGREYFESAVEYKLAIANKFAEGEKRRGFCNKHMPRMMCGEDLALQIYDEVSATLPCHELAVWALYCKAQLQWRRNCYYESIDTFQQLIRRFPKHELAPESYLTISYIYLEQCDRELHNSDLLAFSQINLKKFQQDFPREDRLCQAEANLLAMKELYAHALYETGEFYIRKGRPGASVIYYQNVLDRYPETAIADHCTQRLVFYKRPVCLPES